MSDVGIGLIAGILALYLGSVANIPMLRYGGSFFVGFCGSWLFINIVTRGH